MCAPSWAGRSERDITYLNHWLDQGYAVVASDYQGLGTPNLSPAGFTANAKANAEAADKVSPTFAYVLLILYTIAQTDPSFAIADYVDDKAAATTKLAETDWIGSPSHWRMTATCAFETFEAAKRR